MLQEKGEIMSRALQAYTRLDPDAFLAGATEEARTDPRYAELLEIRHQLLHRVHESQGYFVSTNPLQRMALVVQRTMKLDNGLKFPMSGDVLIPEIMENAAAFAQEHVTAFLAAAAKGDIF